MPVVNQPIIGRIIKYLQKNGISRIIVNAHYHHQQVIDYLDGGRPFGLEIDVRIEPEILGTGGGIKNTSDFWDNKPFIVINGDILTNVNLGPAYEQHKNSGALATLILHDCAPFNQIRVDNDGIITHIAPKSTPGSLAFTGIHIIEPELLSYIPEKNFSNIIECYRQLIRSGESIRAYLTAEHYWRDIGTVGSYIKANREFLYEESFSIGPGCRVDSSAKLEDWAVVGGKTSVEKNVEIRRSILWEEVKVTKGTKIIDSIVTSFREVDHDLIRGIY
jgi:NDP-sugar pyrophosphorylase family protein